MAVQENPAREAPSRRLLKRGNYSQFLLLGILMLVFVLAALFVPYFLTWGNISNLLQRNSIIGIVAIGMLLMILLGGFDLSVGAVGAATSVAAALIIASISMPLGIGVALALGLFVGLLNGLFIAKVGITPFVATLGVQVLVSGVLYVSTSAQPIYGVPVEFTTIGLGRVGFLPIPTIIYLSFVVITWAMLRYTTFGHYIYMVGGNKDAARLAGVNVDRITILTYGLGGLYAGVAGVVLLGTTGIGQPASAADWPLTAIAAVVVGGVPLSGGVGTVSKVVLGTFLLGIIANVLNLIGISPYWQPAITGAVILIAVGIDSYQRKRHTQQ